MEMIQLRYHDTTAQIQQVGAQIASFKGPDGREVIWQADPAVWAQHAPVLFPVCGSVRDGQIRIAGESYPMAKHGFTRTPVFEIAQRGEDQVDLVLRDSEETRGSYPFSFAFHVIYKLFDGGFVTTFQVENHSDRVMPFCVGGHPGFVCPMEPGAAFEDYQLVFEQRESGENTLAPGGYLCNGTEQLAELRDGRILPLTHGLFDERDALIFAGLKSRSVRLVHRDSGRGLRFDFPKMEVLAVWTKPGAQADYLCLEPWHGMPGRVQDSDNFEDKPYVTLLAPGNVFSAWFTATLLG
ncbi:MAG: aldose 1-epimerase family protein [Clostridia bacterium]|nr:aldose 1-epimerase family protein [Clostridia bacterium]